MYERTLPGLCTNVHIAILWTYGHIEFPVIRIRTARDFGLLIRQRRRRLGLSQTELADRAGVSREWIIAVERGKAGAELGLVLRTLAVLDVALTVEDADIRTRRADDVAPIDIDAVVERAKTRRP